MCQFLKLFLLSLGLFFVPSVGFSAACDTNDIPDELLQLIKEDKVDEAVKQAKAAYTGNKSNKQAAFVLARVYINATLRSGVNIDLSKLGFKPGEKGSKSVTLDMLKKATADRHIVDPTYYKVTDQFIHDIVERWPESKSFYYCLTKIHFYSGNHESFLKSLAKTAELQKDNEDEALNFLMTYATELVNAHRFDRAADVYQVLLNSFPESVPLLSSLGVTYIKRGRTRQAMEYFEKAHRGDPKDIIVIGNIAEAAMLLGDFSKAETFLLKKAKRSPDKADIYFDLAMNAIHKGPGASLPYWKKYVEIHAKHPDNENWANNAREIQKAAKKDPDDIDLWHGLAKQMINARVPKYAIPILHYVKQHRPHDAEVEFTMAHAYSMGSHTDLEEKVLLKTLERLDDPENQYQIDKDQLYYNLSRSTYMLERYDDALGYLDRISPKVKRPANVDYMYGLIYRDRGDKDKARKYFRSCIKKAEGASIEQYCRDQLGKSGQI